ncbi:MAG: AsmA-like C-terminal region-containing protein [Chitinophagaceae bacterium]
MIKRLLKIIIIVLLVLTGIAFAIPLLFRDQIIAKIKSSANKNLNAKVNFQDVDISLFRHFPRVAVIINNLQVTGINQFAGDTLIAAKQIDVALNFLSVIRGSDIKVYAVTLDSPRIHALLDEEGRANWDITKKDSVSADTDTSDTAFSLELQNYTIRNGYINYTDRKSNLHSEIVNLNHEGSGDFSENVFTLKTRTKADAVNLTSGNVPYITNAHALIDADIEINNQTNTYRFKTDNVQFNELRLSTAGFLQVIDDSTYNMDISFNAPSTEFRHILSLVPAIYATGFKKIKTSGNSRFNGLIKGVYSKQRMPAYSMHMDVKNGFFQYADLPQPVKNINLVFQVDNPDGITDHTVLNIPQGHIEMDNEPFDFRLLIRNPVSDMFIDAAAKGKINLTNIKQFVKFEPGTTLSGLLQADVSVRGAIAAIEQQQYEKFNASGVIDVSSLQYASRDYPDGIRLNSTLMTFNPRNVVLTGVDGNYKKTHFTANGSINNLLPYVLRDKTLGGTLNIQADRMNVNEWMGTSTDTAATSSSAEAPFAVPANLNITINAAIDRLRYDKLEIAQLSGKMIMKDETVILDDIKGDALEGSMLINGSYSTRLNKIKPAINLDYDVKGLDVQKTFFTFNTVQKLMPVGQYLSGKLASRLSMTGNLGDNMMPDFSSLTGEGSLLLIEGFLQKFAPLEKLAALLNVQELKEFTMKEVKNYIEFTNGKVLVKPFKIKVKDIEMEIGGTHGFEQQLDYLINLKLPRSLMGERGNATLNNLLSQASSRGVPLKLSETVNLHVKMTGSVKNPAFALNLKESAVSMAEQMKKQAVDFAQAKIDSAKKQLKDTALSVKKQLEKEVQEELGRRIFGTKDTVKANPVDSSRRRLEQAGKGILEGILKKKKPVDTTEH